VGDLADRDRRVAVKKILGRDAETARVGPQESSDVCGAGQSLEGFLLKRLEVGSPNVRDAFDLFE